MPKSQSEMKVKISHQPIDICPLCGKKIDGYKKRENTRVSGFGRILFYAHVECVKTFNECVEILAKEL